jgi:hypothetical protein
MEAFVMQGFSENGIGSSDWSVVKGYRYPEVFAQEAFDAQQQRGPSRLRETRAGHAASLARY